MVLFDSKFWKKLVNFEMLVEEGLVSPEAMRFVQFADTAEDGWKIMVDQGLHIPKPVA